MNHHNIDIQFDTHVEKEIKSALKGWADFILEQVFDKTIQLSINICNEQTIQKLNKEYRNKDKPTNVLSFPEELPDVIQQEEGCFIGDIVICSAVLKNEALAQGKELKNHWQHILAHGILHLAKYDHIVDEDAQKMEAFEIKILKKMAVSNPYL